MKNIPVTQVYRRNGPSSMGAAGHEGLKAELFYLALSLQVNKVLRNHLIRPHWMFAMDNIIRRAVQAAVTILIPGKSVQSTDNY